MRFHLVPLAAEKDLPKSALAQSLQPVRPGSESHPQPGDSSATESTAELYPDHILKPGVQRAGVDRRALRHEGSSINTENHKQIQILQHLVHCKSCNACTALLYLGIAGRRSRTTSSTTCTWTSSRATTLRTCWCHRLRSEVVSRAGLGDWRRPGAEQQ